MFAGRELPFVFTNGAVSADGKLALENRSLIQFSSPRDQRLVFKMRTQTDAVLCGAETVETFSIDLTAGARRWRARRQRQRLPPEPLRVLVSDCADIDPGAKVFRECVSPIIILTTKRAARRRVAALRKVAEVRVAGRNSVDLPRALRWLRDEHGVKRVLCEGGGETNAALLRSGVIDELHITVCPLILRGRKAPTVCDGDGVCSVLAGTKLVLQDIEVAAGELFLTYRVVRREALGTERARR